MSKPELDFCQPCDTSLIYFISKFILKTKGEIDFKTASQVFFSKQILRCNSEAFLFNKRTLAASDSVLLCGLLIGGRSQLGKPAIHSLLVESLRKKLLSTLYQVSIFVISPQKNYSCMLHTT